MRHPLPRGRSRHAVRRLLALMLLGPLAACGGGGHRLASGGGYRQGGAYRVPGSASDPWGPYIMEASARFSVPDRWIRAVMRQESGGREYRNGQPITSDAGAIGLMQLMPATYAELRGRYRLGPDPYDPHDNILAGTGYIRELYDRFGSPAFLAAYDAGPQRLQSYMDGRSSLPNETVNYLASVAPSLGQELPMSGPLAAYADLGGLPPSADPVPQSYARAPISRCWQDPNAAYDPDAPCHAAPVQPRPAPPEAAQPQPRPAAPMQVAAQLPPPVAWGQGDAAPVTRQTYARPQPQAAPGACWHDPDAAYDPDAPCQTQAPPAMQVAQAPAPSAPPPVTPHRSLGNLLIPSASAATLRPTMAGAWAIQVGAFADPAQARHVADSVRFYAPRQLASARVVLGPTAPFGGQVLYRARLLGLSAESAARACGALSAHGQVCVTVPPGGA